MTRTARCCCGNLQAQTTGEPGFVVACHCQECQRRTGSVFGVGAYFPKAQVTVSGAHKTYIRDGQSGHKLHIRFCPECGTSVYWEALFRPDYIGVAVGAFADPGFPVPLRSVWEESRHPWLEFGHGPDRSEQQWKPKA